MHTLNIYKRSLLDKDLSTNEKKSQQRKKILDIEGERRNLQNETSEYREYNNILNSQLKLSREKFLIMSNFLEDCIGDVRFMDELICKADKNVNKLLLFSNVDMDSLSYKRRHYKLELENFKRVFKNTSYYEKELYEKIVDIVIKIYNLSNLNNLKNLNLIIT